jgi:hypothetical protein
MRYLSLLPVCIMAILAAGCPGCHKTGSVQNRLVGNWKLISYSGGIGGIFVRIPADSLLVLSVHADGTYKTSSSGRLLASGVYTLIPNSNNPGGNDFTLQLKTPASSAYSENDQIHLDGATLTLSDIDISDGFAYTYIKLW